MPDFIAIDFETATKKRDSACSVGIAVVEKLTVVDRFYSLLHPPRNYFEPKNIQIHGITADMTESAPTFDDLYPQISQWFGDHTLVVAHNVYFDVSVLRESSTVSLPNFHYADTLSMVKPFVSGKRTLDSCAAEFCIQLGHHHNAEDDAVACAEIAIEVLKKSNCITMWEYLALNPDVKIHSFSDVSPQRSAPKQRKAFKHYSDPRPSEIAPTVACINPSSPLYGKNIVFTGKLSIDRAEATQIAVNAGAVVKSSVSKYTDFLVVGQQDIDVVGEDGMSTKEKKAHQLNAEGIVHVQILDEHTFREYAMTEGLA